MGINEYEYLDGCAGLFFFDHSGRKVIGGRSIFSYIFSRFYWSAAQNNILCFWASKYLKKNVIITFRCRIPQCENNNAGQDLYTQEWLNFTTPFSNDIPEKCIQYHFQGDDDDYMQYVNHQCARQVGFFLNRSWSF